MEKEDVQLGRKRGPQGQSRALSPRLHAAQVGLLSFALGPRLASLGLLGPGRPAHGSLVLGQASPLPLPLEPQV